MTRNLVNFVFALLLLAVGAVPLLILYPSLDSCDFPIYFKASQLFAAGRGDEIYIVDIVHSGKKTGCGLNEPPFLLWAIASFSLMPLLEARIAFTIVMLIALAAASVVLANAAKLTNRQTLLLIGLMAASGPVLEICKISKPSPLLFLGLSCCLFYIRQGKDMKAGAWAALCFIKPQEIIPFLVFALGCSRFRFVGSCLAVVLLLAVLTFPLVGVEGYVNYVNKLQYNNQHLIFSGTQFQPIVVGQLVRLHWVPEHLALKLAGIIYAFGLLGVFVFARTRRQSADWWIDGVIISVGTVCVIFPYILGYDLVILIPSLCFLLEKIFQPQAEQSVAVHAEPSETIPVDSGTVVPESAPPKSMLAGCLSFLSAVASLSPMRKCLLLCTCIVIATFLSPLYGYIHYYIHWPINLHFCALLMLSVVSILAVVESKRA